MAGRFVDVCRRRDLKVNAEKSKVMMFTGEACRVLGGWIECQIHE